MTTASPVRVSRKPPSWLRSCFVIVVLLATMSPMALSAPTLLGFVRRVVSPAICRTQGGLRCHYLKGASLRLVTSSYPGARHLATQLNSQTSMVEAPSTMASSQPDLSPAPSSVGEPTTPRVPRGRVRRTKTGGLKNLPIALPANELLSRATRAALKVKVDPEKVKNLRQRAKTEGAQKLDAMVRGVSKPLRDVIEAYEYELSVLHPFEATLADLTVRARIKQGYMTLNQVLKDVNEVRKEVLEVGKQHILLAKNASTKVEAVQATEAGITAIQNVVNKNAGVILNLIDVQKSLRKIPIVKLSAPTVVLVGAPNVGKSSIVRAISTGTPEVNNYPFTTRGMTLGHVRYMDWVDVEEHCQVMDTPGVLNRPDSERNEMEALTLASMQHLPTAVMFVMDFTGHSGVLSSIENQIQIRNDLRKRFPKRPWVDVISKADLPIDDNDPAVRMAPEGALRVSVADGTGVDQLKARVKEMLQEVRKVLVAYRYREE